VRKIARNAAGLREEQRKTIGALCHPGECVEGFCKTERGEIQTLRTLRNEEESPRSQTLGFKLI